MTPREADYLAAARSSLAAAGQGDRDGWLELFTPDGRVEDPVGSRPHIGPEQIGRFYDTFIGPRRIGHRSDVDIVTGSTVIRDLTLDVGMGPTVAMTIPVFLRYVVRECQGELKIAELQAYWELPSMIAQFSRYGVRAGPPGLELGRALLHNQGLGGAAGFLWGLRRVGGPHRRLLDALLAAVSAGDERTARRLLGGASLTMGDDRPIGPGQLVELLRGATWAKRIGAGRSIAVAGTAGAVRGVLIVQFADDRSISRLRYFTGRS
ncbi:MAG: nuclear transport factor 2 family protein [Mycobacterium sp.]